MSRSSIAQRNRTAQIHPQGRWNLAKIAPPQRHTSEIHRAELLSQLDSGCKRKVTLITTSAGYGKTTLAAQWHRHLCENGVKSAWLTLDDRDSSVMQFLSGLIIAFAEAGLEMGRLPQAAARGLSEMTPAAAFATIMDHVDGDPGTVTLLLDDYHRTHSSDIDRLLEQIIAQMPVNMHLLVTSRERPPLSLAGLLIRGQLLTLDSRDLRLSVSEARRILPSQLSERDVAALVERTEGWPAALQLARLWLEEDQERAAEIRHFSGGIAEIADYLTEQVIVDLPAHLQNFLLQTSILERVNGDLANEVCQRTDSWQVLDHLTRISSFVLPLDDRCRWYRYHPLFAEFLRERLKRHPEIDERCLHRHASAWYMRNRCLPEAVAHASQTGDLDHAAALIDQAGSWELIATHGSGMVSNLLKGFDENSTRFPRLQLCRVALLTKEGYLQSAEQLFERIRAATDNFHSSQTSDGKLLERDGGLVGLMLAAYRDAIVSESHTRILNRLLETTSANDHQALALICSLYCANALGRGEFRAAAYAARRGFRHMPLTELPLGNAYLHFQQGQAVLLQGRMTEAEDAYREGLRVAEEYFGDGSCPKAIGDVLLAEVLYQKNELDSATAHLHESLLYLETYDGWVDLYAVGYQTAVAHARARQDFDAALKLVGRGEDTAMSRGLSRLRTIMDGARVQTTIAAGDLKAADRLVGTLRSSWKIGAWKVNSALWRPHHALGMALAEHALAHAETPRAVEILDDLEASCAALAGAYLRVETLILRALAHQTAGRMQRALEDLRIALSIAAPQRMRRMFLDRGQPLSALLRHVLHESPERGDSDAQAFARELRELMLAGAATCADDPSRIGINERQLEVLVLLSRGHSNKTIARMLGTSENTIKYHLKNIYTKLQVDKRRQAVEVAKRRAIIE